MHHRTLTLRRGLFLNPLLTLATVLALLVPSLVSAIPSHNNEPSCNSQGACYQAASQKKGHPKQPIPPQEPEVAVGSPDLEISVPEIFGEIPFPNLTAAIGQTGAATQQAGSLSDLVTGVHNELFDYAGQSSQPEERIARLEPELPRAVPQVDEYAWVRAIPVPEPATLALLGLGLLGMFLIRRGRNKG